MTDAVQKVQLLCIKLLDYKPENIIENRRNLVEIVKGIGTAIRQAPNDQLVSVANYVLLPLLSLLRFTGCQNVRQIEDRNKSLRSFMENDQFRQAIFDALNLTLEKNSIVVNDDLFLRIHQPLLLILNTDYAHLNPSSNNALLNPENTSSILSEEERAGILDLCIHAWRAYKPPSLFQASAISQPSKTHQNVFCDKSILPSFGFIVYRFLQWAGHDKNRNIQIKALRAIRLLVEKMTNLEMASSLIPGIFTIATKIIIGDFKQGQQVLCEALKLISKTCTCILSDKSNPSLLASELDNVKNILAMLCQYSSKFTTDPKNDIQIPQNDRPRATESSSLDIQGPNETQLIIRRDAVWFKKTSYHVNIVFTNIFSITRLTSNEATKNASMTSIVLQSPKIRLQLAKSASSIIRRCLGTLATSIPLLFNVLILFSNDEYPDVAAYCNREIEHFLTSYSSQVSRLQLKDTLTENLTTFVKSLPRLTRDCNDNKKIQILGLIAGYLRIFEENLSLSNPNFLPKLIAAILEMLELTSSDVSMTQRKTNILALESNQDRVGLPDSYDPSLETCRQRYQQFYQHNFVHFRHQQVFQLIRSVLRLVGFSMDLNLVFDLLFSKLSASTESHIHHPLVLFIINETILGAAGFKDPSSDFRSRISPRKKAALQELLDTVLDCYLSPEVWQEDPEETTASNCCTHAKPSPISNVYSSIFALEGIANLSMLLGGKFNFELKRVLYPMLSKLGDINDVISLSTWYTMLQIAYYIGYSSVLELVRQNMDYVVDSLVYHIKYLRDYESTLRVLRGILRYAGDLVIPILGDVLDEVFRCLDERNPKYTVAFLSILHQVVVIICRHSSWFKKYKVQIEWLADFSIDDRVALELDQSITVEQNQKCSNPNLIPERSVSIADWIQRCERIGKPVYEKKINFRPSSRHKPLSLSGFILARINEKKAHLKWIEEATKSLSQPDAHAINPEEYFLDHHKNKEQAGHEGEDQSIEEHESDEEEINLDDTPGYNFVKSIVEKLQHWTSIKSLETCVLVLDTIGLAFFILAEHKRIMLPTLHLIWEPLKIRLADTDYRIMNKTLQVMQNLSICARGFLTRRFIDDIWPILKKRINQYNIFLETGVRAMQSANTTTQYSTSKGQEITFLRSQSYEIQCSILNYLHTTLSHVKMPASVLRDIASTCWFYLAELQPDALREKAIELYHLLYVLNPEDVWCLLSELALIVSEPTPVQLEAMPNLPTIHPRMTLIPNKFKKKQESIHLFYSQFAKNAASVLDKVTAR